MIQLLSITAMAVALVGQEAETLPSGSFLTAFCEANPEDEFCERLAAVRAGEAGERPQADIGRNPQSSQSIGDFEMIRAGRVRSSPTTAANSNILGTLEAGQRLTVRRIVEGDGRTWYEFTLANGRIAYVETSLVREI
ncbi:SH3 domain-containing protein [Marinicauda sp. Alg238-R41]|uniref:SH3 domain-containing protein n=1 Tax=Marinicauda sp. Alg238-R41 TaxID=2993447 RepID=UPI0022E5D861|nr:SH3 domain-containing protein [Marinicauda sp. Alg238-R41]